MSDVEEVARVLSGAPFPSKRSVAKAKAVISKLEEMGWRSGERPVSSEATPPASREALIDACDVACTYLEDMGGEAQKAAAIELRDAVRSALANTPEEPEEDLTIAYMMGREDGKRGKAADGWRPIETAPRDGTWIMAVIAGVNPSYDAPFIPCFVQWGECPLCGERGWLAESDEYGASILADIRFTHWMPLPQPPEVTK